ncbi:hypothetical protein [Cytobacillus massiliigabonensis]|uniref:hypothetical protein n=1 Tax=Cytobacillus massiliigabonensis TaxID=1871011 RepID=UPI000C81D7A9|nr:hypothetical protein [Cytobacillus massiliigabonensis]
MAEQDDTVLLEMVTAAQYPNIQQDSGQLYINRNKHQSLYKWRIITYVPFAISFISLCILTIYLLFFKV